MGQLRRVPSQRQPESLRLECEVEVSLSGFTRSSIAAFHFSLTSRKSPSSMAADASGASSWPQALTASNSAMN
jgi:hypothetical protein